ncbi:unnamed protein product [Dibothriocephalus latus]|uniref:ATP-dependent DNA helicase n=1 Tax=Dibothriocephalus latus TaxID=60516 RepID=A0A3P7N737_DIBLA|nr:unnamed protein product [Dibothriocephalus latus]
MSEDYRLQLHLQNGDAHIEFNSAIFNMGLISIENMLVGMRGEQLHKCGFPLLYRSVGNQLPTKQQRELCNNVTQLAAYVALNKPRSLVDQMNAFNTILDSVYGHNNGDHVFFLDAPGVTGKTLVLKLLLAELRKDGKIILAFASAGTAATFLPGGLNAHSTFKLPLRLADDGTSTCQISSFQFF